MKYLFKINYDFVKLGDRVIYHGFDRNTIMKDDLISIAKRPLWNINLHDFDIEVGQRLKVKDTEDKEYIVVCGVDSDKEEYFILLAPAER